MWQIFAQIKEISYSKISWRILKESRKIFVHIKESSWVELWVGRSAGFLLPGKVTPHPEQPTQNIWICLETARWICLETKGYLYTRCRKFGQATLTCTPVYFLLPRNVTPRSPHAKKTQIQKQLRNRDKTCQGRWPQNIWIWLETARCICLDTNIICKLCT